MNEPGNDDLLTPDADGGSPITHMELVIVVTLVLLGFALRAWHPEHMSVEHFDEGVYASNLYCGPIINPQDHYSYPDRHLYAPPLLPALMEFVLAQSGGSPASVMWVNVLVGSFTVLMVWWVARGWFGPVSAIIACTLAATSEYHVVFSRTALTDPLLCLWILIAVYGFWNSVLLCQLSWIASARIWASLAWWIAVAGVSAGLAWCTKYNGWLALAITGSGTLAWLVVSRQPLKTAAGAVLAWTASALIATAFFGAFVLSDLEDLGGYPAVAANHARYFVGVDGWWSSFLHQSAAHRFMDGWISLGGPIGAILMATLIWFRRFTWNSNSPATRAVSVSGTVLLVLVGVSLGSGLLLGLVGVVGILVAIRGRRSMAVLPPGTPATESVAPQKASTVSDPTSQPVQLAAWLTAAWFLGLLVGVPLYHPYPRLSLPWLIPCWLAVAGGFSGCSFSPLSAPARKALGLIITAIVLASVSTVAIWDGRPFVPAPAAAWQDRTDLARIARLILADTERAVTELPESRHPDFDAVFYVYGEPAVFFHLESLANDTSLRYVSQPAGNFDATRLGATDPSVATFLITGMHAQADSAEFDSATRDLQVIANYEYTPSNLVRLDDAAGDDETGERELVQLFLLHPPLRR